MTTNIGAESRYVDVNGLRLHCLDWGNAEAPALVCVHGFRGNAHSFDAFARRFRDRYHVIAVDVRGRGDSAWAPDGDYSMATYASDLEGVVDALGLDRFSYIGTSMGGRIGMIYAGHHGDRLERFILNDIGPDREAGSDRITAEAGRTPESFASLEEAIAYRASISAPLAGRPPEEQREAALTQVKQAEGGRWVWKNDPEFLRQRSSGGAVPQPELWDVLRVSRRQRCCSGVRPPTCCQRDRRAGSSRPCPTAGWPRCRASGMRRRCRSRPRSRPWRPSFPPR